MPELTIDNQLIRVPEGATILDAAQLAGIRIPTLCHVRGYAPQTSCMVCVVQIEGRGRMVPACATRAEPGLVVRSETETVHAARRTALELALSDHVGECLAPCESICPAHGEAPRMLRLLAEGREREALAAIKDSLVLPGALGYVCRARCERGCRRAAHDEAVAIRQVHRYLAERDLAQDQPWQPQCAPSTGRRVAIVGAGPAGLAAAWFLRRAGHDCALLDRRERPGGGLLAAVEAGRLPEALPAAEAGLILDLGVHWRPGEPVDAAGLRRLAEEHDAVLLATGEMTLESWAELGLSAEQPADPGTHATAREGVFAAGAALGGGREAVRAIAGGRSAAEAVGLYLAGEQPRARERPWSVPLGRLTPAELARLVADAAPEGRIAAAGGEDGGYTDQEARREAARCLGCDCEGREQCRLRYWAQRYRARPGHFHDQRRELTRDTSHPQVVYEPGKCLACGLCVEITRAVGEPLGLTFVGRGFEVRIAAPLDEDLAAGLQDAAAACVEACPTGALEWRR